MSRLHWHEVLYFGFLSEVGIFNHCNVFRVASFSIGVQRGNKRTYKDLGEKRVVFSSFLIMYQSPGFVESFIDPRGCFFLYCSKVSCVQHVIIDMWKKGFFIFFVLNCDRWKRVGRGREMICRQKLYRLSDKIFEKYDRYTLE